MEKGPDHKSTAQTFGVAHESSWSLSHRSEVGNDSMGRWRT